MPDFTTSSQPVGSDEEEKKEDAPVDPFESDEEEKKEEEESSEELDAEQDDIKDKVDNADDEEIGVQEVQDEVRGAASTHVTEDLNNLDNLDAGGVDFSGDVDSVSSKIDGVLQDAGLTPKHIYFCCGGAVLLVILGLVGFFGVKFILGFVNSQDDRNDRDDQQTDTQVEVSVTDDEDYVWVDPSLYGGILAGTDMGLEGVAGVEEGVDAGQTETVSDDIMSYRIEHYGKIRNSLEVDINEYLNDFTDRSKAVDDLLEELQDLYDEGKDILYELEDEVEDYEVSFNTNLELKNYYEEEFFTELEAYDGDDAMENLNDFVDVSQEQVEIKAQYQSRQKLYELIYNALLYLNARIEDVTLNKEALVKGVQVVDVRGSDLELIFDEELE